MRTKHQQQAKLDANLKRLDEADMKTYAYPNAVEFHVFSPGGGSPLCWHCSRGAGYWLHEEPYASRYAKAVLAKRVEKQLARRSLLSTGFNLLLL